MSRCFEWVKEDGRFCLNIPPDKNKGGQQSVGAELTAIGIILLKKKISNSKL